MRPVTERNQRNNESKIVAALNLSCGHSPQESTNGALRVNFSDFGLLLVEDPQLVLQIQYVEHAEGHGDKMFAAVCQLGLEGIVSKKLDAPHKSGPSKAWLFREGSGPIKQSPIS
jgi:hypothetical protein